MVGRPAGCLSMILFLRKKSFETIPGSDAAGSKDNEVYETPYSDDQYEKPYEGHTYAEYEKPEIKTETNKKKILLIVAIVLLIMGLATGIGSYFIMNHEDSEPKELSEGSAKNCEFNRNDQCLDAICSEHCSQCKNYGSHVKYTIMVESVRSFLYEKLKAYDHFAENIRSLD